MPKNIIPIDADIKRWIKNTVGEAKEGNPKARYKLRQILRYCRHFGGFKTIDLDRAWKKYHFAK